MGDVDKPETWSHAMFGKVHADFYGPNHSNFNSNTYGWGFFTWHRLFIQAYENRLQAFDPSVTLPYWDWSQDSANILGSELLRANSFGSATDTEGCLIDGVAARRNDHLGACLKRFPDAQSFVFNPAEVIAEGVANAATFQALQDAIEKDSHPKIHEIVGGKNGQFGNSLSANEAIFYLHHANVDKLWHRWQKCPTHFQAYAINASSINLAPFQLDARSTFATSNGALCYDYSDSTIDKFLDINCPSSWPDITTKFSNKLSLTTKFSNKISQPLNITKEQEPLYKLQFPKPLSSEMIQRMGLKEEEVRAQEAIVYAQIQELNEIPNYVSPSAMINFKRFNPSFKSVR